MRKKSDTPSQESALGKSALLNGDLHELLNKTTLHRARLAAELSSTDQFIQSIRAFARASGVTLDAPVAPVASPRKAPVTPATPPANTKRKRKNRSQIPLVIRAAIGAQTEPWNYINIRAHMDEHARAISKSIDGARLSKELYAARKAGLIKIHKQGPAGGSHSYVTIQQVG